MVMRENKLEKPIALSKMKKIKAYFAARVATADPEDDDFEDEEDSSQGSTDFPHRMHAAVKSGQAKARSSLGDLSCRSAKAESRHRTVREADAVVPPQKRDGLIRVNFGKHNGKSVEELVLKEPRYTCWMLGVKKPGRRMAQVVREARRLIDIFDSKPFVVKCQGQGCDRPATRCVVYVRNLQPTFRCDHCSPYSSGAAAGKLSEIESYRAAHDYVGSGCRRAKKDLQVLVRYIASAKGLPKRVGKQQMRLFFTLRGKEPS